MKPDEAANPDDTQYDLLPQVGDMIIVENFERGEFLEGAGVDRGGGRISNVKLLGKISKNNRVYSDEALGDAARLYEGVPFYLDHPTDRELRDRKGVRSVMDLAGTITAPRKVGDAVRGDIVLLEREPHRSLVFAIAEQAPKLAGNSHRAAGRVRRNGDTEIVEGLDSVAAVELVSDPATTNGLFESVINDEDDMKDLTLDKLKQERPDLVKAVLAESKQSTEIDHLKSENKDLKKRLDEHDAAEKLRTHKAMVATKLAEAKLPKAAVTEFFQKQLEEAEDENAVDQMIADRAELAKGMKSGGGPKSTERTVTESAEEGKKPIKEADLSKSGLQLISA